MSHDAIRMTRADTDSLDTSLLAHSLRSLGATMSAANVVMQLANPAVGYGVARSKVEDGRLDRHPIKRARTTGSYLAVAVLGNVEDRRRFREARRRAARAGAVRWGQPGALQRL